MSLFSPVFFLLLQRKQYKMQRILFLFLFFFLFLFSNAGDNTRVEEGRIAPISDSLFLRMRQGGSWKADAPATLRSQLRHLRLRYVDADGRSCWGEMVVHQRIAQDVVEIFDSLYAAGYRIAHIALVDDYGADDERSMAANNTSAFNFRRMTGTRTGRISLHGQGLAIDINPLWNPYVKGSVVKPRGARRRPAITHNDLAYRLFRAHGFTWGGDWRTLKDYQHFEKK